MTDVVRDIWLTFTEPLEGGVPCLYNDVRGKTTIAYGNLCDTPSEAAALPLMHPGGVPATPAEKIAAWHAVHDDPSGAHLGWRHSATLTDLRLTREGMGALAMTRFDSNERILRARLPDWDTYPACARLAFHSLAWACGANCHYPRLFADAQLRDWAACAIEIHINEWTPEGIHNTGVIPRNKRNEILMRNAQRVDAFHLDPDHLNWDAILGVQDADTLPELPKLITDIPESFDAAPVVLIESTAADHPTRAPETADYLGSDPDDEPTAA